MKPSVPLLLLPALVAAEHVLVDDFSTPSLSYTQTSATPSSAQSLPSVTPAPTSDGMSQHQYDQLPHALKQFILDMTPKSKIEQRQQAAGGGGGAAGGGVAPGGGVPAVATPTQVSPTTTYDLYDGKGAQTYVQTFKSPPDQWSSAATGTIGLGTISGSDKLGKVKTYSNPAPTHAPERLVGAILAGGVGAAMVL